ncbi:RnfH family protein [Luteimonas sp. MC1750]|uniref:RnfH family protein n=1 Tax=Luteimonas sp. MC1750 TaxID=2799326 RepID=UPI0018F0D0A5|nr:RnfH family protein [Luteimonas sp. MC1750]MBJ6984619.1 RnfH family protein [Luteimonas sp. MC1750]QQO04777.1 RnfH family protein [Luteimonas sp. MC1750]
MRVEVVLALPRAHHAVVVELDADATLGEAVAASGLPLAGVDGYAVFGVRAGEETRLGDGDRVELLRPLQVDPKDARRRRAARGAR